MRYAVKSVINCLPVLIVAVALLLSAGCIKEQDFGRGKCREYMPVCQTGQIRCDVDKRGCRVCTCPGTRQTPFQRHPGER